MNIIKKKGEYENVRVKGEQIKINWGDQSALSIMVNDKI